MSWEFRSGWQLWAGVAFALVPSAVLGALIGSYMGFPKPWHFLAAGSVGLVLGFAYMNWLSERNNRWKDARCGALVAGGLVHAAASALIVVCMSWEISQYEEAGTRHYDFGEVLLAGLTVGSLMSLLAFAVFTLPVCLTTAWLVSRFVLRDRC